MISLSQCLCLSAALFVISLLGMLVNRKNVITILMCVELMLLAINTNFIAFSHFNHQVAGQIFVFFILTVAAAETAIGLAIILLLYRNRKSIAIEDINQLKG